MNERVDKFIISYGEKILIGWFIIEKEKIRFVDLLVEELVFFGDEKELI